MGLAAGDVVLMIIEGKSAGQDIQLTNTYKLLNAAPVATTVAQDLQQLATEVEAGTGNTILSTYRDLLPIQYEVSNVTFQRIWPVRARYQFQNSAGKFGTSGLPANVATDALCISFAGAGGSRHDISNKHIGPVGYGSFANGLLVAAVKTKAGTFGTALTSGWVPTGWAGAPLRHVIWNRSGHVATDVESFTVKDEARVQRRRTVGLGK